jgi:hypothetical protein
MSLTLSAPSLAIALNVSIPFTASGGVAPYAFTVLPGGAGGTIDASTGSYVAPAIFGVDTIQVTDSTNATATLEVSIDNAAQLICDIIQTAMGLDPGRVALWNQKVNLPNDSGLFVSVHVLACKPFSNTKTFDSTSGNSIQSTNIQAMLSIHLKSRGPDARDRKEELLMALNSDYAASQQAINSFRVFPISTSFVDLSEGDGAAIPYHFNITVNIQYAVTKTAAVPYFTNFNNPGVLVNP